MSASNQSWEFPSVATNVGAGIENWYAVQTRARHEKVVAHRLCERGVTTFLPTFTEVHRWSDRRKTVELPLFSCYVFVKLAAKSKKHRLVLLVDGVLNFVGPRGQGLAIPDEQIDALRKLLQEQLPYSSH